MENSFLAHAYARYHTRYGGTPLTQAFLAASNLSALAQSFDKWLNALYTAHGMPPTHLEIDESWVLELFTYLHKTRHLHRSVADANAGFEHQFFQSLNAGVYDHARLQKTLSGKGDTPQYLRQYYSSESQVAPQIATKVVHAQFPVRGSRNNASLQSQVFSPNASISKYARGI